MALTTTSYAILGWLAAGPWTTYELAKQMQRNLAFFWPRAESRLYEEPKNLVALGLATRERTLIGRRPRTVYEITDAGREELRRWQASPSAPPSLDFEGLVHLFFGENATPEQLIVAVDSAAQTAEAMFAQGRLAARDYFDGSHRFPERARFSGFIFDFLWSYGELLRDWAKRSRAELETWPDTAPREEKRRRAFAIFRTCLERTPERPDLESEG